MSSENTQICFFIGAPLPSTYEKVASDVSKRVPINTSFLNFQLVPAVVYLSNVQYMGWKCRRFVVRLLIELSLNELLVI